MKARYIATSSVIVLGLLVISGAWAQSADLNTIDGIRANVNLAKANIAHLERIEPWLLVCAVLSIVLGLVTAILQSFEGSWVKKTTVAVSAVIVSLGALKSTVFRIDYSTCDSAILQVRSVISLLENDLAFFDKPEVAAEDRDKTWLRIVRNEGLLENFAKILKESGQPILPLPGFLLVAHAQSRAAQQGVAVNDSVAQTGRAIANNRQAAYKYAKYLALEELVGMSLHLPARSGGLYGPGSSLNSAIDYFNRFGDAIGSTCSQETNPEVTFNCQVGIRVSTLYLRPDMLEQYSVLASRPLDALLRGSAVLRPKQSSLAVTLGEVGNSARGAAKFQFMFSSKYSPTSEQQLTQIRCSQNGRWIFEVEAGGQTLLLPLSDYDDGGHPTVYSVSNDHRFLHLPAKDRDITVTITGYRIETPAPKYAWSKNSTIYHLSNCRLVKNIDPDNLQRADTVPANKTLHIGCPTP